MAIVLTNKKKAVAPAKKATLATRPTVADKKKSDSKGSFSTAVLFLTKGEERVYLGKIFGSKLNSPAKLDYMLSLLEQQKVGLEIQYHESLKEDGELKALLDGFKEPGTETAPAEEPQTADENIEEDVFDEEEEE